MTRKERALRNLKQMCSDGRYLGSGSHIPLEVLEDFSTAIKALEQKQKSEWEQDHAILKAYSDGANEMLDKIRAEIEQWHKDGTNWSDIRLMKIEDILDKEKVRARWN